MYESSRPSTNSLFAICVFIVSEGGANVRGLLSDLVCANEGNTVFKSTAFPLNKQIKKTISICSTFNNRVFQLTVSSVAGQWLKLSINQASSVISMSGTVRLLN